MNREKELLKNTIIIFVGKFFTQILTFLLLPIYTKYLLTDELGTFDLITTYISLFVPVLSLQLEMATFRFLLEQRENYKEQNRIISNNIILIFIFITLSIALFYLISLFIKIKYIGYIILIYFFNMLSSNFMQVARGLGKNIDYSISSIINGIITIALNFILIIKFKFGIYGPLISMIIANAISFLYLFFRLRIFKRFAYRNCNKKFCIKMIKYSLPLVPNSISWWIMSASDRTIISTFLNTAANGIYAVSNKFPTILTSLFGIFNISWSENVSLYINSEDKDEYISNICNEILVFFGFIGVILICLLSIFFDFFIDIAYKEAYLYIPILTLASFLSLIASQYGSIYVALKDTKKIAITSLISATVNIIINVLLINSIGLYAAAISTLISYLIIALYRHFDIKKSINIKYNINSMLIICSFYCTSIVFYYYNNLIVNAINLCITSIAFCYYNRKMIKKFLRNFVIKCKTKKYNN